MNHVSLFSGIGGMDLAAEWAGFQTTAVCEIDAGCRKILARHFPNAKQFGDIREITNGSIETPTLVSAGFPCQPFSIAGSRQGDSDERHLWPEVVRVLGFLRPRWLLGENVRGLLSISGGRVFGSILADLAHLGYSVGWGCYGADEACGAPHRRDRVFIVGYLAHPLSGGCRGRDNGNAPELRGEVQAEGPCGELANAESLGRSQGVSIPVGTIAGFPGPQNGCGDFPPGPGDLDAWRDVLRERPDLAPALNGVGPGIVALRRALRTIAPGRNRSQRSRAATTIVQLLQGHLPTSEEAELQVRPVVDGVSRRMALRMLGNAVVPAQVYPILQAIADHIQGEAE